MICERAGSGSGIGGGGADADGVFFVQDIWPGHRKVQRGPNLRRRASFTLCAGKRKGGVLHVEGGAARLGALLREAGRGGANVGRMAADCRDAEMAEAVRLRILTPVECERLQGLPDDHTRWGADGTELSDTRRYNLVGRAVPPPAVRAIASRIAAACGLGGGGNRGVAGA